MATTTIPQKTVTICDCCKNPESSRFQNGRLILKRDALDWSNAPCADATVTIYLCDDCMKEMGKVINSKAQELEIRVFMDGDKWCAVHHDFVNLQESPAGFGDSPDEARACLSNNVSEHAPLSAGASVDHGVEVETTQEHEDRGADRGCCDSACSLL